jgi:hypothetical protein
MDDPGPEFVERGLVIDEDNPVSLSDLLIPGGPVAPTPTTGGAEMPSVPQAPAIAD